MGSLKIYCDGGARGNPGPGAGAFVAIEGEKLIYKKGKFFGKVTNNEAEYGAVIMALEWLLDNKTINQLNSNSVNFFLDSELVVKQLNGLYKIKSKNLLPLILEVKNLEKKFSGKISYANIQRDKNFLADALVNETLDENG